MILKISLHSNPRGPGFWKLNTSLLTDTNYIEVIKLIIQQTREEYENDDSINPSLLWDMREKSLSFGSAKKRKTVHKEQNLEDKIAILEKGIGTTLRQRIAKNKYKRTT